MTVFAASIIVLMFVCGIVSVGMAHQTAWLVRSDQPMFRSGRESANRARCGSNMRQIGQAITLFALEHEGRYPDLLEELITTQDVTPEVFVCVSSNVERAEGKTPAEQAAHLRDHCSYIYHGRGLTTKTAAADRPILCEPQSNHFGQGMNILFGDGHVDFVPMEQAERLLQQFR